jgi:hypothetical protein
MNCRSRIGDLLIRDLPSNEKRAEDGCWRAGLLETC